MTSACFWLFHLCFFEHIPNVKNISAHNHAFLTQYIPSFHRNFSVKTFRFLDTLRTISVHNNLFIFFNDFVMIVQDMFLTCSWRMDLCITWSQLIHNSNDLFMIVNAIFCSWLIPDLLMTCLGHTLDLIFDLFTTGFGFWWGFGVHSILDSYWRHSSCSGSGW